jgi:transposase
VLAIEQFMLQFDPAVLHQCYRGCGKPAVPPELMLRAVLFEILDSRPSPAQWHRDIQNDDNLKYLGRFITPSRSTCYEFRWRLGKVLDDIHQQLLNFAQKEKVLNATQAVLDGSFFRGLGSRHRMLNEDQLNDRKAQLAQAIANPDSDQEYPKWMGATPDGRERQALQYQKASEVLKQRQVENSQRPSNKRKPRRRVLISPSDPESVITRDKEKVFCPVYNAQTLVDVESLLIIGTKVFASGTDWRKLGTMIDQANQRLNSPLKEVWADAGYCSILDIQDALSRGVELFAPFQANSMTEKNKQAKGQQQIPREQFAFLKEENAYRCPAGHQANYVDKQPVWRSGNERLTEYRYRVSASHCGDCPLKAQCLRPTSKSRTIKRLEGAELIEDMKTKMATPEGKARIKKRGQIVERTFGDTKQNRSMRRYHGYGLKNAEIENGLAVLAQNVMTLYRLLSNAQKPQEIAAA